MLDSGITFLNHGSYGACPIPVFEDYQNWQKKLENQPVQFMTNYLWESLKKSREHLAEYINCSSSDILLFSNSTTAINNLINNLSLMEGDEVLMTQHEYGALVRAWDYASKIKKFKVVQKDIDLPLNSKQNFIDQFLSGVNSKTKVIFMSQVTSQTALIFPVKEICEYAKRSGIITIIDGAHVPGHIKLDIEDLDCDYYTGACHKWLCAPKGASFLFVRENLQKNMIPQTVSWGEEGEDPGPSQFLMNFQWQGTRDMSAFLSIPSAIKFVKNDHWKNRQVISREIISDVSQQLESLLNTSPLSVGGKWIGQMVSHPLPKNVPPNLKDILWEDHSIEVPIFEWKNKNYIRVSIHGYNDRSDIKKLIYALDKQLL